MKLLIAAFVLAIVGSVAAVQFGNWLAVEGRKPAAEYDER